MADVVAIEKSCMKKITWRLIPYLLFLYMLCYIDRTNLAFAGLTMTTDLALTASIFGFGAGLFFIGYFFFEVPSNICLAKFGARRWIARIMVSWGLVASLMCMIQGQTSFLAMRFLLGAAEAGFFPGVIYFIGNWFPTRHRGRALSQFNLAQPIALMVGSLVSGIILSVAEGAMGIAGWRWLFFLEGIPTVFFGFVTLFYLTDKPSDATWLTEEEREWLTNQMAVESQAIKTANKDYTIKDALLHPSVLLLGVAYFLATCEGIYGINMWIPQMLKQWGGMPSWEIGILGAIPFFCAFFGMAWLGWHSDKCKERKWHLVGSLLVGAAGLVLSSQFGDNVVLALLFICVGATGMYAAIPLFWTVPAMFLSGTAAATGIAVINSVGNLGGFFGPTAVGMVRDATGSFGAGLILLGCSVTLGAIILYCMCVKYEHKVNFEKAHAEHDKEI